MKTRERPAYTPKRPFHLLALALLFCVPCEAKQPLENPPPRIRLESRIIHHRRYVAVPLMPRYRDHGSHLEFLGNSIPRGWKYCYDETGFQCSHFFRSNPNGEGSDYIELEDAVEWGLPW